ncbi:hypothetical protein L1987_50656 [Smallanthus sonchifolius]|uniref:Uncharacterized protein n=1 Tax=Smallanthus sonchifolius TaxID=185202 RepID=A0ACB9ENX7_9ASTR|nr:hypothetical protein L1987_50656 [Smallanthus sonchifolius]
MANDLCFSSTCKLNNSFIPTVFFYDLSFLCSFIVSHPLYFSYFIFFSPYLFKFIFFISPLFLTTSLLLILSVIATTFPQSKLGFIQTMVDKLRSKLNDVDEDDEFRDFEDYEIYKIVFHDPPLMTVGDGEEKHGSMTENAVAVEVRVTVSKSEEEKSLERLFEELDRFDDSTAATEEAAGELCKSELAAAAISGEDWKTDENSFSMKLNPWRLDSSSSFESCGSTEIEMKENEWRSCMEEAVGELQKLVPVKLSSSGEDQKTVQNSFSAKSNSTAVIEMKNNGTGSHVREALQKFEPAAISISGEDQKTFQISSSAKSNPTTASHVREVVRKLEPAPTPAISTSGEDHKSVQSSFCQKSDSWRLDTSNSFGSYGSMRKDKEWKRTLACKLFEERNNSSGGEEGMDSLWEAYEDDNSSKKTKNRKDSMNNQKKTMIKSKKKSEFKFFDDGEEEDDDEDEFMSNGQLCCLKALKLSTGKMNLGMGKPNLVKISKAIKGFGWLHHVGSKHGKKN